MPNFNKNNEFSGSRFRGVFRSGNRWKAQVQLKQVSYYAGTYDTELEAAREFDKRARKEGAGSDFKYNFDENGNETPWVSDFLLKKNTRLPPGSLSSSKSRPAADYWNASQQLYDKENSSSSRKREHNSDILIAQDINRNTKAVKLNHVPDHSNKLAAMQIDSLGRLIFEKAYSVSKRILKLSRDLDVAMNKYIEMNGKDSTERKKHLGEVTRIKDEIQKLNILKEQCGDVVNSLYSMVQGEFDESSFNATGTTDSNIKSGNKKSEGFAPEKGTSSPATGKTNTPIANGRGSANTPAVEVVASENNTADSNSNVKVPTDE